MHYRTKQNWNELKKKFNHIIAYGTGPTIGWDYIWKSMGYECQMDGRGKYIGKVFPGGICTFSRAFERIGRRSAGCYLLYI